jgi:hypothetical protein
LFLAGPIFSAVEWISIHPLELSYYNIGLRHAFRLGFEATYWYDAVTPRFLRAVNEMLPPNANLVVQVDELINPEVLFSLQAMGRLRGDVNLNPPPGSLDNWVLLLTHSSKATPFTKLLYLLGGRSGGLSYGRDGVRLVTLIEPRDVNTALAAVVMAVKRGAMSRSIQGTMTLEPLELFEPAFAKTYDAADWKAVASALQNNEPLEGRRRELLRALDGNVLKGFLPRLLAHDPKSFDRAVELLNDGDIVRRAVTKGGYLTDESIERSTKHR